MTSLLIVGGSGFIGRNLLKRCLSEGFDITIIYKSNRPNNIDPNKIKLINLDITNSIEVKSFFLKNYFEYIINLSGYINHHNLFNNGIETFKDHVDGLINIIDSTKYKFPKTLIQIGTSDEYGNQLAPQKEDLTETPLTPYALAKTTCTKLCQMVFSSINYPCIILRPFLVFGPDQKENRLIPYVINSCLNNEEFEISSGNKYRDFIYIDNFSEYVIKCLNNEQLFGEVINIGSGDKRSVRSVVRYIQKSIKKGKAIYKGGKSIKFENQELYADIEKLKKNLLLNNPITFEEGMNKTITHYINQR